MVSFIVKVATLKILNSKKKTILQEIYFTVKILFIIEKNVEEDQK